MKMNLRLILIYHQKIIYSWSFRGSRNAVQVVLGRKTLARTGRMACETPSKPPAAVNGKHKILLFRLNQCVIGISEPLLVDFLKFASIS